MDFFYSFHYTSHKVYHHSSALMFLCKWYQQSKLHAIHLHFFYLCIICYPMCSIIADFYEEIVAGKWYTVDNDASLDIVYNSLAIQCKTSQCCVFCVNIRRTS